MKGCLRPVAATYNRKTRLLHDVTQPKCGVYASGRSLNFPLTCNGISSPKRKNSEWVPVTPMLETDGQQNLISGRKTNSVYSIPSGSTFFLFFWHSKQITSFIHRPPLDRLISSGQVSYRTSKETRQNYLLKAMSTPTYAGKDKILVKDSTLMIASSPKQKFLLMFSQ